MPGRFTEIESAEVACRPELAKALRHVRATGAMLVTARFDRLSHNAAFFPTQRDSGGRFLAVDMPFANDLTVAVVALVADNEGEAIPGRTKEALEIAKPAA